MDVNEKIAIYKVLCHNILLGVNGNEVKIVLKIILTGVVG